MKSLLALGFATIYGLAIRYCFVFLGAYMEVISISLVLLSPFAIGALTVALSGLKKISNGWKAFARPWVVTAILLVVTIVLAVEGIVCWVIIYPFFSVAAGLGGLMTYHWMRWNERKSQGGHDPNVLDDWDRFDQLKFSPLLVLPVMLGAIENDFFLSTIQHEVTQTRYMTATPHQVWQALLTRDTSEVQVAQSWFEETVGLPRYLSTHVDTLAQGGKRLAYYERGLFFEETMVDFRPDSLLRLRIKSDPGSIPPNVLDEHVVIGGKYFRALEDTYRITALPNGHCTLELSSKVELCTPFNWYARLWAHGLLRASLGNILENVQLRAAHFSKK